MTDPMTQFVLYLLTMFLLGLILGWLFWGYGWSKQRKVMSAEVDFWRSKLKQSQLERQGDIDEIATLNKERQILKKRVAANPA